LDIYDAANATRGTIVFVHGGGFTGGDKRDGVNTGPFLRMRERGWDVVSVNYRLADPRRGVNLFPTAVRDVDAALDWIRANGAANNVNTARIVVAGESAGGAIAALIGTAWNSGRPEFAGIQRPTAYVAVAGVLTDQTPMARFWHAQWVPDVNAWGPVVSAYTWLDSADPPAWLIHGDQDNIVESENSRKLREKADLGKYGHQVTYDLVDVWSDNTPMPAHVRGHQPAGGANIAALGDFLSRL
jgi:acetyl esterase/lipase